MKELGYLIVLRPAIYIESYEASEFVARTGRRYDEFRRHFSWLNYRAYRGISRAPLGNNEFSPRIGEGLNAAALNRLSEVTPELTVNLDDDCFIENYEDALEIYNLLEDQHSWEVIEVRLSNYGLDARTLGFDVGFWRSDHYSIIADTAISPMWHCPDPADWAEVSDRLSRLNEHLLFDSPSEAEKFRAYYKTKAWAEEESEPGEFAIIEVRSMK
jgi:hypothetical protein